MDSPSSLFYPRTHPLPDSSQAPSLLLIKHELTPFLRSAQAFPLSASQRGGTLYHTTSYTGGVEKVLCGTP
jgi:hypothetical protein